MRKKRAAIFLFIFFVLVGITSIVVGVFAYQFGLDNNPLMGNRRKLLVVLGVFLLAIIPTWKTSAKQLLRCGFREKCHSFNVRLKQSAVAIWLSSCKESSFNRFMKLHIWIWAVLGSIIVIVCAIWYLTAGTFSHWMPYSRYFDRQADAFLAGQLALLEQPPAELAQVTDIFNWKAREGINYLWDASYYQGKYYIYWGPIPALVAAGIKLVHIGVVEDQVLVLLFVSGFAVVLSALLHWLRRTYFPSVPGWTVTLFSLVGVLNVPVFWLVNRPSVYEAAIASAQFYLMLGIYGVLRGITAEGRKWGWLALTGFSLGCAVASRFSYVFTVILMSLVAVFMLLKDLRHKNWKISPLLSFSIPLIIIAAGFAWFNYARFGSITETGMKYQLTGDALPVDRSLIFSTGYISPNGYSSLLRPLQFKPEQFPFFSTPYILDTMWPSVIHRPKTYYSGEQVAGIFTTIPFLWLLGIVFISGIIRFADWINEKPKKNFPARSGFPVWGFILISTSAIGLLITNLTFVMTTMRYLADFTPLLILLTEILVWDACSRLNSRTGWRRVLLGFTLLLIVTTVVIGLLTNMQGADRRFENNNPTLYNEIASFFVKNK